MFILKKFTANDLDGAINVWNDCNREVKSFLWDAPSLELFINAYVLIDTEKNLLVGYISLKQAQESESLRYAQYDAITRHELDDINYLGENTLYIRQIGLLCEYQGKGLGKKMLRAIFKKYNMKAFYALIEIHPNINIASLNLFTAFMFWNIGYLLSNDHGNEAYEDGLSKYRQDYIWRIVKGVPIVADNYEDAEFKISSDFCK